MQLIDVLFVLLDTIFCSSPGFEYDVDAGGYEIGLGSGEELKNSILPHLPPVGPRSPSALFHFTFAGNWKLLFGLA